MPPSHFQPGMKQSAPAISGGNANRYASLIIIPVGSLFRKSARSAQASAAQMLAAQMISECTGIVRQKFTDGWRANAETGQ